MAGHKWQPGESGNPNGRPPKQRALTEILERTGSQTLEVNGKRLSGKRLAASLIWQGVTRGEVLFPQGSDGKQARLELGARDWLDLVKFIYAQIDGAPKAEVDLTSGGQAVTFRVVYDEQEEIFTE